MKEKANINNFVVAGSWNLAIFSPEWIKQYILTDDDFEVAYPINDPSSSPQYKNKDFYLTVRNNRLEVVVREEPLKAIECIRSILQKLQHTPLIGFGVNFEFILERSELCPELEMKIFTETPFTDLFNNYKLVGNENRAIFRISEKQKLNFIIDRQNDSIIELRFNYHTEVQTPIDLLDVISDSTLFEKYHKTVLDILEKKYNLRLEDI